MNENDVTIHNNNDIQAGLLEEHDKVAKRLKKAVG
jgi:hypothetical protein